MHTPEEKLPLTILAWTFDRYTSPCPVAPPTACQAFPLASLIYKAALSNIFSITPLIGILQGPCQRFREKLGFSTHAKLKFSDQLSYSSSEGLLYYISYCCIMNVVQWSRSLGCLLILNYREQVSLACVGIYCCGPFGVVLNVRAAAVPHLTNEHQLV